MAEGTCVFHGECSAKVVEQEHRIRDLEINCREVKGDVDALKHLGDTRERRFTEWCQGLSESIEKNDAKWDDRMLKFEQKLANHLPPWVTLIISLLTACVAWFAK